MARGPLPTPAPAAARAVGVLGLVAALVLAVSPVPAAATTTSSPTADGHVEAAYDRAWLLGRVFGDDTLAETVFRSVTATVDLGDVESDIAGPPDAPPDQPSPAADAAAPTEPAPGDATAAQPPDGAGPHQSMVSPGNAHSRADPTVPERGFEMEGDVPDEWSTFVPQAPLAVGGAGAYHRGAVGVGGWVCPVPAWTWFTHDWGFPRSGGRTHKGNDIFAPKGTPLLAATDGVVVKVRRVDRGLGGLTVNYLNDAGLIIYNAHLDSIAPGLAVGQPVAAGQPIGTIGNSGNARTTPPHLHIGVYPAAGGVIDPYPFTSRACR